MEKVIPIFNASTSHVSSLMNTKQMKSDIDALVYALSSKSAYVSSNPNLAKTLQEKYPKLGIKEVKIPEPFLRCLMHIAKSTKAKDHFFNISKSNITIADTGRDELEIIFRKGTKFNFGRLANQYVAYHDALIKKGFFQDPKKYESCNMIDASEFFRTILNNLPGTKEIEDSILNYVSANPLFAYLPCFNDGVLKMSDITYCYWKINSVDAENRTISISIYLYHSEPSGYTPFATFSAILEFPESLTEKGGFMVTDAVYPSLYEILHAISPKQMKWEVTDRKAWGFSLSLERWLMKFPEKKIVSQMLFRKIYLLLCGALHISMQLFMRIKSIIKQDRKNLKK